MKPLQVQGAQQGATNEAQKTGSFYNRAVEVATPVNIGIAVAAIAAYMMYTPILVIGVSVGCALVYRRLTAVDPFTVKLEKMKSGTAII